MAKTLRGILRTMAVVTVGALVSLATTRAHAITYQTPTGAKTADGSVDAVAIFTLNNGSVTITLENLFENPKAAGQLISGITFKVSGVTGYGSLSTKNSGNISQIQKNGSYASGTSDSLTRWKASKSGSTVSLTTLSGGKPDHLIIGPDNAGGFARNGSYKNANSSITGDHNPSVLGTATFNITISGVTSASVLSDVVFQFGTTSGCNLVRGQLCASPSSPVPDGGLTIVMFGMAMTGLALVRRKLC